MTKKHALLAETVGNDRAHIDVLIQIASDASRLQAAEHAAAKKLLEFDGEVFPSDGCAITLSTLLQEAGIDCPDVFRAIDLGTHLQSKRQWAVIPIGQQQAGDVGSTCGPIANHGADHIYLVLKIVNSDEMIIADNQSSAPHFRFISGKGKTPTRFFLRPSV